MCGTLRFENRSAILGRPIPVMNMFSGKSGEVAWSGFLQSEKLPWWRDQGRLVELRAVVSQFAEKGFVFNIPNGYLIAFGIKDNIHLRGKLIAPANTVRLLTRAPKSEWEASIHSRWPITPTENGYPHIWTWENLVQGQLPLSAR